MAALVTGTLILAWAALMALRALMRLRGLDGREIQDLVAPGLVLVLFLPVIFFLIPGTGLLEQGHDRATLLGFLAVVLVVAVLPGGFALERRRGSRAAQ